MERQRTLNNRRQRQRRVRMRVRGTGSRPRLSIRVSNRHISAQLIDDEVGRTLVASSSQGQTKLAKETLSAKAAYVGEDLAKRAQKVKIKTAVFDRGHKLFHGRVKNLADAARSNGLEF